MERILEKKVNLTELFYDLVFVYAISQMTHIIHSMGTKNFNYYTILMFLVAAVILINGWMIQMIYTNRYGCNHIIDNIFMFCQMGVLLYLCNTVSSSLTDFFIPFNISAGILYIILTLQYVRQFFTNADKYDKKICRNFILILSIRFVLLFASVALPIAIGVAVSVIGIIIPWFMPLLYVKDMQKHPVIFSHVIERLSLLVIITFGEMIIGVVKYFSPEQFSFNSILILFIVVSLFISYILEIDNRIDENAQRQTGSGPIYLHYLIVFGLSFITIGLNKLLSNPNFTITLSLYFGVLLFYTGVLGLFSYNKPQFKITNKFILTIFSFIISGFCLSFFLKNSFTLYPTTGMLLSILAVFIFYGQNKNRKI